MEVLGTGRLSTPRWLNDGIDPTSKSVTGSSDKSQGLTVIHLGAATLGSTQLNRP